FNDKFNQALTDLQQQAQPVMSGVKARRTSEGYSRLAGRLPRTEFLGYQGTEGRGARVLALIAGEAERDKLNEGEPGEVLLDRTPFYAEAGGKIGDTGRLEREGVVVNVEDTYAPIPGYNIHKVTVERGTLRVGDLVDCRVDAERRRRIKANHTGTHLLHAALRDVLGPHVKQAGSLVAPDRLRFDFTHYASL